MTSKSKAGVLILHTAYKVCGENLVEIPEEALGLTKAAISRSLSYALISARKLHIRLNQWDSIEMDLVENHINHQLVDINFLVAGQATHRVLGVKVIRDKPVSFQSVSVHEAK